MSMTNTFKKKLYSEMLRLRLIEEKIAAIYHQANEIKTPTHLYTGQEAVAVGVANAMVEGDVVSASHRSHGMYIAKGGDLKAMMAELFGKEAGCSKGWGGSMHLVDVAKGVMGSSSILGGTIPHAVGCALAFQIKDQPNVAVAAFGDAAIEEGVFHESLNWAALKKLPVIFVCENNLYSTSTPLKNRQPPVEIFKRAESYGIDGIQIDGNDVIKVYEVALKAMANARKGKGPTLIEAMTYRWREHVGPNYDYDLGYRSKEELQEWMSKCPLKKYAHVMSPEESEALNEQYVKEVDEAIEYARQCPFPREEILTNEVL